MRALALFSGGLDSMLAVKLITEQGIDVTALHINIGFGSKEDRSALLESRAKMVGADFEIVDTREQFISEILFNPKYGYGKNFNPCIDCHANMFRIAKALMPKYGASFIVTGEVIGQRPMSQRAEAIRNVTKLAGDEEGGIILRPLSAKRMAPTVPEKEGWVDREKLLDIEGRGREVQLELAQKYGFEEYESPGGGCLLTEPAFAQKIRDVLDHGAKFRVEDIDLLKVGRHLRLPEGAKLIIGKNREDNERIARTQHPGYIFAKALDIAGPLSLIEERASEADRVLAARLILTYTKTPADSVGRVQIGEKTMAVKPFESKKVAQTYFVVK
ncbi:MAG: ATP-binding protein [Campylobacteraceae bacterium 4484_4]|nr:MAG: ATP-binding protein [Campylobacteraceae bacterium 4484_4]